MALLSFKSFPICIDQSCMLYDKNVYVKAKMPIYSVSDFRRNYLFLS